MKPITHIIIILCFLTLIQARPFGTSNFMLWNYFPFLQQQRIQMMQPANMPVLHQVDMHQTVQYPTFEMYFNPAHGMPIVGEVQFHIPAQQNLPSSTTTKTTTEMTTNRPSSSTNRPSRRTKQRASFKSSTPSFAECLKSQLSKGIFEMARKIQAKILTKNNLQQTGKFNVFSPINVAAVLSLLELGAKGQTNQELKQLLGFDNVELSEHPLDHHYAFGKMLASVLVSETISDEEAQINMAKGIFMQTGYTMKEDYRTSVETIYQSQVTTLNFQQRPTMATKFINDWVKEQTNGKIGNILKDGIDKNTRMMVAGAVYFKALWQSGFIPAATSKRPFYPNGREGQKVMVNTMGNGGEFNYYKSKDYDCSIMALPFKGHTTTMYIILPNKSDEEKLKKLQATLTYEIIEDMILKMTKRSAFISLPKMHLSDTMDLKVVLEQLGVESIFGIEKSDLSGITGHNDVSVDGFIHKVDITINEAGTEAAAATATHLSRQEYDVEFRVDSPFMFFVRHEDTKLPLFYGSVIEPLNDV